MKNIDWSKPFRNLKDALDSGEEVCCVDSTMRYWGRWFGEPARLIWVGPMTEEEMLGDFCEFRHNSR